MLVTMVPSGDGAATGANCEGAANINIYITDELNSANDSEGGDFGMSASWVQTTMADFNFDGFDDLLVMSNQQVFVATAWDVDDPAKGINVNHPFTSLTAAQTPLYEPTTGDFNGDGLIDFAWIGTTPPATGTSIISALTVYFGTVCPSAVDNTICAGAEALQVILSSQTIPQTLFTGTVSSQPCSYAAAVTAGQFTTATINTSFSELAFGAFFKNGGCDANVLLYRFADDFTPSLESQMTLLSDSYGGGLWLSATRFDWYGSSDQIAVGIELNHPSGVVGVITVDPASAAMTSYTTASSSNADIYGMAVGVMGPPAGGFTTAADYTPQIAMLSNDFADSKFTPHVKIFTVNAAGNDYTPALSNTFTLSNFSEPADVVNTGGSLLHAGDLQGRSMRLGEPFITRAPNQIQPEVILGHPPMHVDYVLPNEGTSPTIFNFSVLPDEYYTLYDLDTTSTTMSSNTSTTSYSYAMSESVNEKVKFTVPLVSSISGSFTQAWSQTYSSTTSQGSNSYESNALNVSTSTGFGDELWISSYDFNIYSYPVIGQTVCPDGEEDCSSSEQGPLYVQYSGPDQVVQTVTNGPVAEWYQPVFEPGQVFSYPWSTDQLALQIADPQPLTGADSVLLAENTLPAIPSFNSSNTTVPNWTLTSTSFDSTDLGDTYQVFWVLVWAEDGSGNMLPELVGHGLSADPHSVTINYITDVPLEMVSGIPVSSPQLPTFSNNLGLLQQAFYVAAAATPTPTPTTARRRAAATADAVLSVEDVQVSDSSAAVGEKVVLSARIRSRYAASAGFMVTYFDADPNTTNRAFDVELVSHIGADETYQVRVPYVVQKTGSQELVVIADRGRSHQALGRVVFNVASPTPTVRPAASDDDDGCAIQSPTHADGWMLILAGALLICAVRRRVRHP